LAQTDQIAALLTPRARGARILPRREGSIRTPFRYRIPLCSSTRLALRLVAGSAQPDSWPVVDPRLPSALEASALYCSRRATAKSSPRDPKRAAC